MENKILITGATGATGSGAIEELLKLKIPVRAMVRKIDDKSNVLADQGVEVVEGDLTDFASVSSALKGITGAYFLYPVTVPGLLEAATYFAQAALEENVGLIVNISQRTSRREAKSHAAQNHWFAERLFDRSGVPVTHIRPTLFDEWLLYFAEDIKANHRLISNLGDTMYASIAAEDIGRVVASILAKPEGHAGQTYPLFGPAELSEFDIAEILSGELGTKITYVPMEISDYAKVLESTGKFTPYFIQHVSAIAQDFRDGILKGNNNNVELITGKKPLPIADFIKKNIASFK